jgi:hypothetical protein
MRRPFLYVVTADLNPEILKRIDEEGFEKGFGQISNDMINEILNAVTIRNLTLQQIDDPIESDD